MVDWRKQTERGYLFCKEAAAAFASGDYRTKREILSTLCKKAVVKGKNPVLTIGPPFVFIQKKLDEIKTKLPSTEPKTITGMALDTANKSFADAVKTAWLRRSYQVRTQIVHHKVPIYSPEKIPMENPRGMNQRTST